MIAITITHFDRAETVEYFRDLEGFKLIFASMTFGKPPRKWRLECDNCKSSTEGGPHSVYKGRVDDCVRDTVEFIDEHENCMGVPTAKVN